MGCFPCFDSREEEELNPVKPREEKKEAPPSLPALNSNISRLSSGLLEMSSAASINPPSEAQATEVQANDVEEVLQPAAAASTTGDGETLNETKKRSFVWDHFRKVDNYDPKKPRSACIYCGTSYASGTKKNGTSMMKSHLETSCKKSPFYKTREKEDNSQKILTFSNDKEGKGLVGVSFSLEACKTALARMIIVDELPFKFVEGEGFRHFVSVVQPKFSIIPYRTTIARMRMKLFVEEKIKLRSALKGRKVCVTTDTWTSIQNLNYMCLTAHFIDSEWKLQKRILNFCQVANHKGETIGKLIEKNLLDWSVGSIFTVTVDNASSNNLVIDYLRRKTKHWDGVVLGHQHIHMRCSAHILNLIVCEGLKEMRVSVSKVRNAVRYVRSSPSRLKNFKKCVEKAKITCNNLLVLDVPTRWNSTYMMLDVAEKFEMAFDWLEDDDLQYLLYFTEEDGGKGKKILGPPGKSDWTDVRMFVKFLKVFYDATLRFSGSLYVTSNAFFHEVYRVEKKLLQLTQSEDVLLREMVLRMQKKYEAYWNVNVLNILLYISVVLDPRYKLAYVYWCYERLKGKDFAEEFKDKLNSALVYMYEWYVTHYACSSMEHLNDKNVNSMDIEDADEDLVDQFRRHMEEKEKIENKSEVERFLAEKCEIGGDKFQILDWWKNNAPRYRILSLMAQDVLAIPISSVASESAFSTGGRVLDSFRTSLAPHTVEALICAQDWLRSPSISINLRESMDDIEKFNEVDAELFGSLSLSEGGFVED